MGRERQLWKKSLYWYLHALNYPNKSQKYEMFSLFIEDFQREKKNSTEI